MTAEMETDIVTLSEEQGEILPREKETSSHDKLQREILSCLLLRFPRELGYDLERRQSKMDDRLMGRSRSYGGNSQEWKEFKLSSSRISKSQVLLIGVLQSLGRSREKAAGS